MKNGEKECRGKLLLENTGKQIVFDASLVLLLCLPSSHSDQESKKSAIG
jgi:hypothetical protein